LKILTPAERLAEPRGAKIAILGRPGVGKTHLLRSLNTAMLEDTLFIDAEAGDIVVADLPVASIRPRLWTDFRDVGVIIGGPDPARAPDAPYSEAHFRSATANSDLAGLARFTTLFIDSISEASRRCLTWAERQPEATTANGRRDVRATYGIVAREMIGWLLQLQQVRTRNVIFVAVLEKVTDDFNVTMVSRTN
jgi:hypothetical protein